MQTADELADPWDPTNLLPLGTLAAELNVTVDALARKLGDDAIVLDDLGLRCITRSTARAVISEHAARQSRQRDLDAQNAAATAEVAKRAEAETAALLAAGGPVEYTLDDGQTQASGNALADLMRRDR